MMKSLLGSRKFGPFFLTQFLGAFNDNVFKNALVIMLAFKTVSEGEAGLWVNIASGLFILPFFLFSPIAGQLSDRFAKDKLIRIVKFSEIIIMILGACAFLWGDSLFLIIILFLMGSQSTLFGPVKYSILPQHLRADELMTGTSLVEMGTFVAILLGTVCGGILYHVGVNYVAIAIVGFAILGWLSSRSIPYAEAAAPGLKLTLNPFAEFKNLLAISKQKESIFLSIVGISWFWFFGATILAQIPTFVKHTLHADETLVTLFLSIFTLSIAIGSYICDKVADSTIELGLVPIGTIGMSLFIFDLGIVDYSFANASEELNVVNFLWNQAIFSHYRVIFDFTMIGIFGSFFIVPLYALIQHRSKKENCSRVIAANNILNSLFMVCSAVMCLGLYSLGLQTQDIFLVVSFMNVAICFYLYFLLPEFVLRFGIWLLAASIYTLKYTGRKNIPMQGPGILVANHVSFIDWFILSAACQRPVRFIMDHQIFKIPVLNKFFRFAKCIPIAPEKIDPECKKRAFVAINEALQNGEIVCIFPEGEITSSGKLLKFRRGVEVIAAANQVPVIPIALKGLWGSFFSRQGGKAMGKVPKPKRRLIQVVIGEPISEKDVRAKDLEEKVQQMLSA